MSCVWCKRSTAKQLKIVIEGVPLHQMPCPDVAVAAAAAAAVGCTMGDYAVVTVAVIEATCEPVAVAVALSFAAAAAVGAVVAVVAAVVVVIEIVAAVEIAIAEGDFGIGPAAAVAVPAGSTACVAAAIGCLNAPHPLVAQAQR